MYNIKQINTGVAELLAYLLPIDTTSYDTISFPGYLSTYQSCGQSDEHIKLPPGNWITLGIDTELTEAQCREVVEPMVYGMHRLGKGFKNYSLNRPEHHPPYVYTAKEAFASLMQANGCYSVNPCGEMPINKNFYWGYLADLEKWQQAEANTGTRLILKRLS